MSSVSKYIVLGNSVQSLEDHDPLGIRQAVNKGGSENDQKEQQVLAAPPICL